MDRRNENRQASLSHLPYRVAVRIKLNDVKMFQNHKAVYKFKLKVTILWEKNILKKDKLLKHQERITLEKTYYMFEILQIYALKILVGLSLWFPPAKV